MYRYKRSTLFHQGNITIVCEQAHQSIRSKINAESENYILNANEIEYAEYLESNHLLATPIIHFDEAFIDSYEDDIPAEMFPGAFNVYEGKSYKKEIIQYIIPVTGRIALLNYRPAMRFNIGGSSNFQISGNNLITDIINFSNDAEQIKTKFEQEKKGIISNYQILIGDITAFNDALKTFILNEIKERKEKILSKNNLLASLGVPLRKKAGVSETFAIPRPQLREKIVIKPVVYDKAFEPEPTLDMANYRSILKLINDAGKNFERMPSLYDGKGEEDLRDHILFILDPNFDFGSASGETFNKTGKTDILLRYNSSNVFIAECKFWSGEKNYLATITQLLGYLTWRDTKASVVIFVKQKDITAILSKIEAITSSHPNYLNFVDKTDENWFNYRFHLNGDKNREVKIAMQVYHLP